jgi:hypothetical protein
MPAKKKQTTGEHAGEAKKPQPQHPKKVRPVKEEKFGDSRKAMAVITSLKAAARAPLEVKEQKDGLMVVSPASELGGREFARTMLGTKPYRTNLVQDFAPANGTVNTAYTQVYPVDIALASDIASWLNLFDDMRMDAIEMRAIPYTGSNAAAQPVSPLVWTAAFDPEQSGAVSSNAANLKSTRHIGPCPTGISNGVSQGAGQYSLCVFPVSPRGHVSLHSGPLAREVLPISSGGVLSPNPVRGAWVPTNTASAVGGYFKWYAEVLGTQQFFGTRCSFIITAEFRIRG